MIIRNNFCFFWIYTYVVTPHLNGLDETVQLRGHKTNSFDEKYEKLSLNTPSYLELRLSVTIYYKI